ncbi:hypothetical protein GCM10010174_49100 [Kutzneria viridogrisea]|uniref:AraC-like DNA-binding protein n=1 Tax=Kutzneria viridogrisea TaxID=47990 RepID=A0ABR6B8V5_9PSEU|nr:AraC-like DNA-binding protein [Kutzneria viridogrisea]
MPARSGLLPVEHLDFTTSDPEAAQAKFDELYLRNRLHRPDTGSFSMRLRRYVVGGLCMDQLRLRGSLSLDGDPFRDLVFGFLRGGRWSGATRREELRGRAGLAFAHPMQDAAVYTGLDLDCCALTLPADAVRRAAAEQFGHDRVRFVAMAPISSDMRDCWRAAAEFARQQLRTPPSTLREPLVHTQVVHLLAAVALAAFPNTTMTADYLRGPGWVAPAGLRRAVAFIDAHADQPLTLSGIAAAARVGPRALQYAFRRHHNTTPMGYLRRVRLDRAHQDLLAAVRTGADSVAEIARRWGFANPARFAALYRESYGRPPHGDLVHEPL